MSVDSFCNILKFSILPVLLEQENFFLIGNPVTNASSSPSQINCERDGLLDLTLKSIEIATERNEWCNAMYHIFISYLVLHLSTLVIEFAEKYIFRLK
eukprot:Awhi_evm1s15558